LNTQGMAQTGRTLQTMCARKRAGGLESGIGGEPGQYASVSQAWRRALVILINK